MKRTVKNFNLELVKLRIGLPPPPATPYESKVVKARSSALPSNAKEPLGRIYGSLTVLNPLNTF